VEEIMEYVIYFNSNRDGTRTLNSYGYWTGQSYMVQGEIFPVCTSTIDNSTKRYKTRKNAVNGAEKAYLKFGYVSKYDIEGLED
jgi:hypothetical protein